jgi:hypothetical protein
VLIQGRRGVADGLELDTHDPQHGGGAALRLGDVFAADVVV